MGCIQQYTVDDGQDDVQDDGYWIQYGLGLKERGILEDISMDRRWCLDGLYGVDGHNASRQQRHNKGSLGAVALSWAIVNRTEGFHNI